MTEEQRKALDYLKRHYLMKLVVACIDTPKSARELEKITHQSPKEIAEYLEILERHQILQFVDGKWKPTELGRRTYEKYFT